MFRRLLCAVLVLLAPSMALAQKTPAQIQTEIGALFPDNSTGFITPQALRTVTTDLSNSFVPTLNATTCASSQWFYSYTTSGGGTFVCKQPSYSDLSGTLGGDLSGTLPNPTVANITGSPVNFSGASTNDTITYNGSSWVHSAITSVINAACTTSALRSTCAKLFGYANILWWGAACDGATNDSTAIQAWYTALPTAGTGIIPAGLTCLFNGIITVPSGAYFSMYGATLKTITNANSNTCICFSQSDQLSAGPVNAGMFGGTVDGNTANRATPGQAANIYIIAAQNITIRDVKSINSSGTADCFAIGGDTTHGLSSQVVLDHVYALTCHRNPLSLFGVSIANIVNSRFSGGVTAPGNGIDIEPDNTNNPDNYVTILNTTVDGNAGCGIAVNPGAIAGAAVVSGQAMNITGFSNTTNDFCQYTTAATKAGFRFINAHGTFGGTTPAVDALP